MHLTKWSDVLRPRRERVWVLPVFNLENGVCWWWRFGDEKDALWRRNIESKYGEDGGVGFLQQFIGIRCQVYRGSSHVWEISQM